MKTPSEDLFRLVKSLSPTERRYFRLKSESSGSKNPKYLELFDAMVEQEYFDDTKLQKRLYPQKKVESRKFSELKNYLFQQILQALETYDQKNAAESAINRGILHLQVLFRRGLQDECQKLLRKLQKQAGRQEDFSGILELLRWEKELAYTKTDIAYLDANLADIRQQEEKYFELARKTTGLRNIFFSMLVTLRKEVTRSQKQLIYLEKLVSSPLLTPSSEEQYLTHQILQLRIWSLYQFSVSDFPAFYQSSKKLVELLESAPHLLKSNHSEYIAAVNNHLISCGQLGYYREVRENLEKLRKIKPLTEDDRLKIHRQYYMNKFRLCINTGEFEQGVHALNDHQKALEKFDTTSFEKGNFYFQYFYIYFGAGNFTLALHYLNEWLNMPRHIERQDLQALARVLNLLIHYEMGNIQLLESLMRSTKRYLKKEKRIFQFELAILDFLNKAADMPSQKANEENLKHLQLEFQKLVEMPAEGTMMRMFDFPAWVESKLEGVSLSTVMKKNNK